MASKKNREMGKRRSNKEGVMWEGKALRIW
jgi:hypothetical protein